MGGGHSPLGPQFGLGVDQMLEVELVGADGSYIVANENGTSAISPDLKMVEFTEDNSLFWAMRGGGAGPWGAVTAMTIKLHKAVKDCQKGCYHVHNVGWISKYEDEGKLAKELATQYLKWISTVSDYWSGYFYLIAGNVADPSDTESYSVMLAEHMYTGQIIGILTL